MIGATTRCFDPPPKGPSAKTLPKPPVFLYAPAICDVRPAPGRMQRIGGGGNGAAMQKEDMAGAMGASI